MEGCPIDNERFRKLLLALPAKALELLYRHYYHSLLKISNTLTHNLEASADIVQDTFIHVWENHKKLGLQHEKSFDHYLVKVVRYKSISYFKANLRWHKFKQEFMNHNNHEPMEGYLIKQETIQSITHLIQSFPKRERECLTMKWENEMTNNQIAVQLNISVKAVERSLTSAYKRLRKYASKVSA